MKPIKAESKSGFIAPEFFLQPLAIKIKRQPTNLFYKMYRRSPIYDIWTVLSSPVK